MVNELAGKPAPRSVLANIPRLISSYYTETPDVSDASQRVSFGTSGHRGSSLRISFNEDHILAISQAICEYRKANQISGPMFIGKDTHSLSEPAFRSAMEVFAAAEIDVMIQTGLGSTPTPVISHAILQYNKGRQSALADGVVITPSHNPPEDGGFKYNPPHGGPAGSDITTKIETRANEIIRNGMKDVRRVAFKTAMRARTTHEYDFILPYVNDLKNIVNLEKASAAGLKIGVDPLGGASIDYWDPIAEIYGLSLDVVNRITDPTFFFMPLDHDGKIRMDCSSMYAMAGLIGLRDGFDIAFGNDTDADRHGIVTRSFGLLNPNHYLSAAAWYLYQNRPQWNHDVALGKTVVSSSMLDRVSTKLNRQLYEVPVGFKWFVDGLLHGSIGLAGEESAGGSFLRKDGTVWCTDKDGIIMDLLAVEILANTGKDPGQLYAELEEQFGRPAYKRIDAPATPAQKTVLQNLSADMVTASHLAGDPIISKMTHAPANNAPIGGLKVVTTNAWFAARPSGTEDVFKVYLESFKGADHLQQVQEEALELIQKVFKLSGL
ncbi:MAG TPA: phosphoglucomutase (alpha-D-glucose-1,6-bisphosphate-dependent) [Acidobacteriota bacterium]|nr:phosphoglucomutase (alpha-D-glucose-1,6-bisphosphate-dependent) [Acidobacteriota bacterium]